LRHCPGIPSEDIVVKHKVLIADISFEVFMVVIVLAYDRIGPEDGSSILLSNIGILLQDCTFIIVVIITIIIIIIIIIIGKTALFEPWSFSEDSVRFVHSQLCVVNRPSCFHFFGCCKNNFFTEQSLQPCVQPPAWGTRSLYLCPSVTGWASYIPRPQVPFSSRPMTHRATVEVFEPASTQATSMLWLV
jgi:hypothetical protein